MSDISYEQTIELEKNIKIKNQANEIYEDFLKNFTLDVRKYKDGRFKVWSDSNNATYLAIENNVMVFQCRFLHENYNVKITPSCIFNYIKENYRGLDHFVSAIETAKENNEVESERTV